MSLAHVLILEPSPRLSDALIALASDGPVGILAGAHRASAFLAETRDICPRRR